MPGCMVGLWRTGDQRRLTGSGSALEVTMLYTNTRLFYFYFTLSTHSGSVDVWLNLHFHVFQNPISPDLYWGEICEGQLSVGISIKEQGGQIPSSSPPLALPSLPLVLPSLPSPIPLPSPAALPLPLNPARGSGECCKLPQWGPGWSPDRKRILRISWAQETLFWEQWFMLFVPHFRNLSKNCLNCDRDIAMIVFQPLYCNVSLAFLAALCVGYVCLTTMTRLYNLWNMMAN